MGKAEGFLFVVIFIAFCGLMVFSFVAIGNATPILPDGNEQVKVFVQATGNEEGARKLEDTLNGWLKENSGKVQIVARTQGGTQFATVVTVWYKENRR